MSLRTLTSHFDNLEKLVANGPATTVTGNHNAADQEIEGRGVNTETRHTGKGSTINHHTNGNMHPGQPKSGQRKLHHTPSQKDRERNQNKRIDWLEAAKSGMNTLPAPLRTKIRECWSSLVRACANDVRPEICAVYFHGIPRVAISDLKKHLAKCLPRWSFLSISFISVNTAELLCHRPLKERLIATAKALGFRHAPAYDRCRPRENDEDPSARANAMKACARRCAFLAFQAPAPAVSNWYKGFVEHINAKLSEPDNIPLFQGPRKEPRGHARQASNIPTKGLRPDDRANKKMAQRKGSGHDNRVSKQRSANAGRKPVDTTTATCNNTENQGDEDAEDQHSDPDAVAITEQATRSESDTSDNE